MKKNNVLKSIPKIQKRKDVLIKHSDILNPKYSYLKLIPSSAISNYDSSALVLLVNDLFKSVKDRIHIFEMHIFQEKKTSIRYMIDISKDKVEFFYVIPEIYKNLAIETIGKMWNGRCTVQEISKDSIRVLQDPSIYELRYKYEDLLSLKTDKKSNTFLGKALNIIEIMGEKDSVQLAVNLMPYKRTQREWKTFCDDIYDRFKKNLSIEKDIGGIGFFLKLIGSSVAGLFQLIVSDLINDDNNYYTISGDNKNISTQTKNKALDATKIIDTQIAVLTKSDSRKNENILAKSFCNSFKEVSGDNELLGYKLNKRRRLRSEVSIHNKDWNICVNKLSADELSNFISIAGKSILDKFKNIEHIATKQCKIIEELSKGIVQLGLHLFKNEKNMVFLNEYGQFANLPILILTKMGGGKSTWFENVGVCIMRYYRDNLKKGIKVNKESFLCIDFIKQNELSYNIMNNMYPEDILLIDLSTEEGVSKLGFHFKEAEIDKNNAKKRLKSASLQGKEMMKLIDRLNEDSSNPLTSAMRRYLNCAFQICYIHDNKSLRDAIRIIENYDIRHEYIDMIPENLRESLDDEARALLELDDEDEKSTKTNLISGIVSRIYALRSDPTLKAMYNAKPDEGINLTDAMQEGKGIFILMPDDEFDRDMINIISTYVISRLFFACKKRGTINPNKLTRCTLLIDEINLAPGCLTTLNEIIGQLRKYKLRPIISAHNFTQIKALRTNLNSVGVSLILPQGTLEDNFLEFENAFKKEGFIPEDLQTLELHQTLNLIETSKGKKAFISKFPPPVNGKIEDRDDISITEFKEIIKRRIEDFENSQYKSNENNNIDSKINDLNKIKDFNKMDDKNKLDLDDDFNKYVAVSNDISDINNISNTITNKDLGNIAINENLEDLNDEKYDNLFKGNDFDD